MCYNGWRMFVLMAMPVLLMTDLTYYSLIAHSPMVGMAAAANIWNSWLNLTKSLVTCKFSNFLQYVVLSPKKWSSNSALRPL